MAVLSGFRRQLASWLLQSVTFGGFDSSRTEETAETSQLLAEVETVIASGAFHRPAGIEIERRFAAAAKAAREALYFRLSIMGTCVYNLYLIVDFFIIPDVMGWALLLQLGVATPVSIVSILLLKKGVNFNLLAFVTICVMTACTLALMLMSRATYVDVFPLVMLMFVLSANVMLSFTFKWAFAYTFLFIVAVPPAILLHPSIEFPLQLFSIAVNVSVAMYSLAGNFKIETGIRTAYLLTIRESLRADLLAKANVDLRNLADMDGLTRVANRRRFDDYLRAAWQSETGPVCLLMIDIDHFKAVNDVHGHLGGDQCLCDVGRMLTGQLNGPSEIVARYGGEEFAVVLLDRTLEDGAAMAERIREAVASLHIVSPQGERIRLTVSIGCASIEPDPVVSTDDLIAAADAALYQAKQGGRNQVRVAMLGKWPPGTDAEARLFA